MDNEMSAVLKNERRWAVVQGDCLEVMRRLGDGVCNLVVTSPPY